MMKRCVIMVLVFFLTFPSACMSQGLQLAAPTYLVDFLSHKPGFSVQDESKTWEYVPHEICALYEYIASTKGSGDFSTFYFSLKGESNSVLIYPVLNILYRNRSSKLEPEAVSFLLGNTRYDFAGKSSDLSIGGVNTEIMRIPVDEKGLSFWRMVCSTETISIQMYGKKLYSTTIELTGAGKTTAQLIGAAGISGSKALLKTMDSQFPLESYLLWDLNLFRSEEHFGIKPRMVETNLLWATENDPFTNASMGVLYIGTTKTLMVNIQSMLIERGFQVGKPESGFGAVTKESILLAQKEFGLLETGFADRTLLDMLERDDIGNKTPKSFPSHLEIAGIGVESENTSINLVRYWVAAQVFAVKSSRPMGIFSSGSADEKLLIVDGSVKNKVMSSICSKNEYECSLNYDGINIPAIVLFEANNNSVFQDTLLPLSATRIVIIAKIPALQEHKINISLVIKHSLKTEVIPLLVGD